MSVYRISLPSNHFHDLSTGDHRACIPGRLCLKIICSFMDDHRLSKDIFRIESRRVKHHPDISMIRQNRRQIACMIRMRCFFRVIMSVCIPKGIFFRACACTSRMNMKSVKSVILQSFYRNRYNGSSVYFKKRHRSRNFRVIYVSFYFCIDFRFCFLIKQYFHPETSICTLSLPVYRKNIFQIETGLFITYLCHLPLLQFI